MDGNKDEIFGVKTLFREIGYYISRLELYEKSLTFFDRALSKTPDDKRALIGRSRTRAKACEYEGAIRDINRALKLDPDDLVVLADKALNTYLSCEFEEGLVQNSRLIPKRQKPDHFVMGIMHSLSAISENLMVASVIKSYSKVDPITGELCTNAIETCLGHRAGRPLRDHFRVIRKQAWKKNCRDRKPFEPKPKRRKIKKFSAVDDMHEPVAPTIAKKLAAHANALMVDKRLSVRDSLHSNKSEQDDIPSYSQPFLFKPLQRYTTNIENYMAEKYLDAMYLDKIFLKKLQIQPGSASPNVKGSAIIKKLAKNGYKTVAYKQELLRTRRPFYYIKYQEATSTGQLKLRQEEELRVRQETSRKEADTILKKLQEAHKEKKLRHMLDLVEKLKTYCDSKSKRILLDKDYYLDQMYAYVRRGFYELNRLTNEQYVWDQEKRIQYSFGLDISREPSRDSVISEFKNAFVDYKKREQLFEQRLKNASTSAEMCWCYHELSRCLIELKRHELARVYGKKCIQEGRNCHLEWVLNGTMLMAKINVQQHNKPDARKRIMSALNLSMELQDTILSDYLNMCLTVIEKIDFEGEQGPKVLEKREKNIVSMMVSAKMKEEVTHLFRMMSVMPASRRMLVMPGVRIEDIQKKSRNQSIVANQNKPAADSETTITSTISKRPHKKKSGRASSRGVGFMELIQYHMD